MTHVKHTGLLVLALCILATPTLAQTGKVTGVRDADAEYNALIKGYNDAQQKFLAPYEKAKTIQERLKIHIDTTKNPALTYLPRFQAFARQASGSEAGARALVEVIELAQQVTDPKAAFSAADSLIADHIQSPCIGEAAIMLRYSGYWNVNRVAQILHTMISRSQNRSNKAAAMYSLAFMYSNSQGVTAAQKSEATSLFTDLAAHYTDTTYGKQAAAGLFELKHLQIGMTAPDFEAMDEKGERFKLSDYRGKVVVVDFWGFW